MNLIIQENQSNCTTPFQRPEYTTVAIVSLLASVLSFVVCCFTIALILILNKWQFFSQRLILYLTLTALSFSLANIVNRVHILSTADSPSASMTNFCIFGGFLTQVTTWMGLCSIISITLYIFAGVVCDKNAERFEWAFLLFTFVFPLAFNWIPFIRTSYGNSGVWCWIRSFDLTTCEVLEFGKWLQYGLLYIPVYSVLFVLLLLYVVIIARIYQKRKLLTGGGAPTNPRACTISSHDTTIVRKAMSEVFSLFIYPIIYTILSIPLLVNRLYSSAYPTQPSLALWYVSSLSSPLLGACTGLAFTFHTVLCRRPVWAELRAKTKRRTSRRRVLEYPMRTNAVSDSATFSEPLTVPNALAISTTSLHNMGRQHSDIDYTKYP